MVKNQLASDDPTAHDTLSGRETTQDVEPGVEDGYTKETERQHQQKIHRPKHKRRRAAVFVSTGNRSEYRVFAEALRAAMDRKGLTASDLARLTWGSTTDSRGYSVAKGRDRIGHYLSGASFPNPGNLDELARALDVTPEDLAGAFTGANPGHNPGHNNPGHNPGPRRSTLTFTLLDADMVRLTMDQIMPLDLAMQIVKAVRSMDRPPPGTVISGDKPDVPDDNQNDTTE